VKILFFQENYLKSQRSYYIKNMRKIINREQKDKKTKRKQLVVGLILIGVMIFGSLGYAFNGWDSENSEKINYNGISFVKDNSGYWDFNIQGSEFMTKYNPKETENLSFFSYTNINDYLNKPLYFVSEFNEPNFEISRNLKDSVLRIQNACLSKDNCLGDFPIKNCSVDNIIIVREPLENESENIYSDENCVFITADAENQTLYADVFLFKVLGIN